MLSACASISTSVSTNPSSSLRRRLSGFPPILPDDSNSCTSFRPPARPSACGRLIEGQAALSLPFRLLLFGHHLAEFRFGVVDRFPIALRIDERRHRIFTVATRLELAEAAVLAAVRRQPDVHR